MQAALALGHFQLCACIAVKFGHIHTVKCGVDLAIPFLPIAAFERQQALVEFAHRAQACADAGRQGCIQPQLVFAVAVSGNQIYIAQGQWRQLPQFVSPLQLAVAHDEFSLREEPVER